MKQLNMKRILISVLLVAALGTTAFLASNAFFSDEETSTGNTFQAGAVDLKVDSQCTYLGQTSNECGTWKLEDLGVSSKFFNFTDNKPGDYGENTISLHVVDNDAHACMYIENMSDDDLGLTEPEGVAGDTTVGVGVGELSPELHFFAWKDNGNNVWEDGETPLFSNIEGPASDALDGKVYPLGILPGAPIEDTTKTTYMGIYWCYGKLTADASTHTLSCDGSAVNNLSQTDKLTADIRFYVEQARNNPNFVCPPLPLPSATVTTGTGWSAVDLDNTNGQSTNLGGGQEQSEWFAKARNNNANFEIAIGTDDDVSAGQSTAEAIWVGGDTETFTLSYNGAGSATLNITGETPVTFNVGGVGTLARIGVNVKAPVSTTTTVDGLALSVVGPLSDDDVTVTGGTNNLLITGANLNQSWTLTGTFVFSAVGSGTGFAQENPAVQFSID